MRQTERMGAHGSTETRKPVHSAIEGFPIFHVGINLKESKLLRGFRGQRFTRKSGNTPLRYRGSEWGQTLHVVDGTHSRNGSLNFVTALANTDRTKMWKAN